MGIDLLIAALVLMLGGSSAAALKERSQLKDAHTQAVALAGTVDSLKSAEAAQAAAIAREDADRKSKEADIARQAQIRGTYHVATGRALKAVPPDVPAALQFNTLAIGADDPLSALAEAQGEALAAATEARQAQLIADLQAQLAEVKGDNEAKTAALAVDVKDRVAATAQIGTLTGSVAVATSKLEETTAEKTDLLSKLSLLTAKYGQWVFWSAVVGAIIFVLAHVGLFTHLSTVKKLNTVTAAHTAAVATIATQAATIQAHVQTISALALAPPSVTLSANPQSTFIPQNT
jgi:hypothetical protein